MLRRMSLLSLVLSSYCTQAAVINLNFNQTQFTGQQGVQAQNAFVEAANFWETTLKDDVVLNFNINYTQLSPNVIGSTSSTRAYIDYTSVGAALINDAKGATDDAAIASLNCNFVNNACELPFMENLGGVGVVDNNGTADNKIISMTTANAKALGYAVSDPVDATITFNSDFSFDYDRTNGIQNNLMDFVGVTIHEIGHALGFTSGVDVVDNNPGLNLDPYAYISTFDLFRYSAESAAAGVIDMRTGGNSYFSIDGGNTALIDLSTGSSSGDGQQASHFKDNINAGIMDPTFAFGEYGNISLNDLMAFDAIGWDLQDLEVNLPVDVSEPYIPALLLSGLGMIFWRKRGEVTRKQK